MPATWTSAVQRAVGAAVLLGTLMFACGSDVVSTRPGGKSATKRVGVAFAVVAGWLAAAALVRRRDREGLLVRPRFSPQSSWRALRVLALILAIGGCETPGPTIQAAEVSPDDLPSAFDTTRTYHAAAGSVDDPMFTIRELLDARIPVRRAWQPLDDRCSDPLGPRFTVDLERDDPRIRSYGFERGEGRLRCATRLMTYVVVGTG